MRRFRIWFLGVGLLSIIISLTNCAPVGSRIAPTPTSNWTVEDATNFDQFEVYWMGESHSGLRLTAMQKFNPVHAPAYIQNFPSLSFSYGDFYLIYDAYVSTWSSPLEVDVYHRCDRTREAVLGGIDIRVLDPDIETIQVRGVDAYVVHFSDDLVNLHMWTGQSAIKISTSRADLDIVRIANELTPISENTLATEGPLPPPESASACPPS